MIIKSASKSNEHIFVNKLSFIYRHSRNIPLIKAKMKKILLNVLT